MYFNTHFLSYHLDSKIQYLSQLSVLFFQVTTTRESPIDIILIELSFFVSDDDDLSR